MRAQRETILKPKRFLQIQSSTIVNASWIEEITTLSGARPRCSSSIGIYAARVPGTYHTGQCAWCSTTLSVLPPNHR